MQFLNFGLIHIGDVKVDLQVKLIRPQKVEQGGEFAHVVLEWCAGDEKLASTVERAECLVQ